MGRAKDISSFFCAMTGYLAPAVRTGGRPRTDRTFEATESTTFASRHDFESFVVIVSAGLTFSHISVSLVSAYGLKTDVLSMLCQ
jgi:hypothetical protein